MLTAIDKAIVAALIGFLGTLNAKYGFHFDTGGQTSTVLTSLVDAAINGAAGFVTVYFFPNKAA